MRSHAKASSAGSTMCCAKGARPALLSVVSAVLFAAVFAASAQAAPETIAEYGKGAGQVHFPTSTAVDQSSGDLYVADRNNFRVSKFDSAGSFLLAWGYGVADGVTPELQTCGPEASPPTTRCFSANFFGGGGTNPDKNLTAESVAVDQSSGDVYVSDNWRVSKFTPSGQLIYMVGKNVNKTKEAEGGATQAEKDFCTPTSGNTCGRGASGTAANEFSGSVLPLAVDSSGVIWVGDTNRIASFDASGAPGVEIALSGAGNTTSLALDSSGDFYVKSASFAGIRKLAGPGAAVPGELLATLDAANNPKTVTLDGADNIYIGHCVASNCFSGPPYRFDVFNPAGEKFSQFGAGQVIGTPQGNALAVGESAEKLYVASNGTSESNSAAQAFPLPEPGPLPENQHVEDLEPTTVTLAADLNPEGHETTYHFEYGTSESYGSSTPTETLAGEEFESEAVAAEIEELIPDTTYHFRLVATNHCNNAEPAEECTVAGADQTFTTRPAVAIEAQWASEVAAHSAKLNAELNPLGVTGTWWIEYGTSAAYGSETAHEVLPASFGGITVASTLTGLASNTTYHYRFVATDVRDGVPYRVEGADQSFTTGLSGLGFRLADNRAWEMVSPAQKYGARIGTSSEGAIQAAEDGSALTYLSLGSTEAHPEASRVIERSSTLARRGTGGVWANRDITPPQTEVAPLYLGNGFEYKLFTPDLSRSALEPRSSTLLSPEASERAPYLRQNTEPAAYTPLVTGKEGFANVPPGTEFGGDPNKAAPRVRVVGATSNLTHILIKSEGVPLATGVSGAALYEWTAGQLTPVSVKPAAEGGTAVSAELGTANATVRGAVSDDGSRVFWSPSSGGALYLRDLDREETVRLDVVQPGAFGTGGAAPVFQGANPDGTVAYFTDSHNLTEDANESGRDLYRCEVTTTGGELGCELSDITANGDESAEVQGLVAGMNDEASDIYLVAKGVFDTEPNAEGDSALGGEPNLYLWQQGAGFRFIATLAESSSTGGSVTDGDGRDWAVSTGLGSEGATQSATASPSGRYLAFMSERSLTGYDNRDTLTGELAQEVFRYDAATDSLICASCNPSGAAPRALVKSKEGSQEFDPQGIWDGRTLAAVVPEVFGKTNLGGHSLYRPRAIHDNGRLFFNAADSLVPGDSNGAWDVYQYEPSGLGDCGASSAGAATSRSAGGCVSLISSGTGEGESVFLDASEGGEDVFFLTDAQLSVTDEDHVNDVYDARVDGIPATLTPHPECQGEACQPPATPPNDKTPASATFKGPGNLRYRPNCGAIAHRTGRLSQRARRLRRHAKRSHNPRASRRMQRKARRFAHRAQSLGKRAKRCRRANRRAH